VIVADATAPHVSRWMAAEDLHLHVERLLAFYRVPAQFPSRAWQRNMQDAADVEFAPTQLTLVAQESVCETIPAGCAWRGRQG
jgi:hypothetical protein